MDEQKKLPTDKPQNVQSVGSIAREVEKSMPQYDSQPEVKLSNEEKDAGVQVVSDELPDKNIELVRDSGQYASIPATPSTSLIIPQKEAELNEEKKHLTPKDARLWQIHEEFREMAKQKRAA